MKFTPAELRSVAILEGLPEDHIAWFSDHGDKLELARGDHLFDVGQPADFMFLVVRGSIQRFGTVGGETLVVATTRAGEVTGMLPYSRMTHYPGTTVAAEPSQVLRVRQTEFPEMLHVSTEIGRRLIAVMTDRVRGDVRLEQQRDRMVALGRLSAGLAHEINNPASAVRRAASALSDQLAKLPPLAFSLIRHGMDEAALEAVTRWRNLPRERATADASPLERSEREESLAAWLESHDVPESWELAEAFLDAGITLQDLEGFRASVPEAVLGNALAWIGGGYNADRMVAEIASASARVSELVASVKSYSHMDRSPEHKETDVRAGLNTTLTMLDHKLKLKNIRLTRDFAQDLPSIRGNAGELNQVWTNLIDNAIDAMDDGGALRVAAREEGAWLSVRIIDDGHGIDEAIRERIFEPFFTTKSVGEGTGLGLDIALRIVRTHGGNIDVQSGSGGTEMCVRLPLRPA